MPATPPAFRTRGCLLLCTAALLLVGCRTTPAIAPPAPPAPPTWQGTLTVWAPLPPENAGGRQTLEQHLGAYSASHPGLQVQLEIKENIGAALEGAGAARPDLALAAFDPHLWPQGCPARAEGSRVESESWLPGVAAAFAPPGALCGVPLYVQGQVLALNLAAWRAAGVQPPAGGRWTLAEFEGALKALRAGGVRPLSFFALPGYPEWWPLFLPGDSRLLDPAGRDLTLEESAVTRMAAWERDGLIDPDGGKLSPESVYAAFTDDPPRLAMLPVPARLLPNLRLPPYRVADLGVAAFPDGANLGRIYGYLLTGSGDAARQGAALALAAELAGGTAQLDWARSSGGFPAGGGAGNPYPGDAALTAAQFAMERIQPLPAGAWWPRAEALLGRHLQLAMIGGESPAEAVAAARAALTPILREAGT